MPDPAASTRRYRRLLVTYPRAYRRQRGEEMVDTMMQAAAPGRSGPTVPEAVNMLMGGLRARLGRPRSRLVVLFSVVTALMAGLVGSALGYRLAWQAGAGPLPTTPQVRRIAGTVAPGRVVDLQRNDYVFGWQDGRYSLLGELARWPLAADASGMQDPDLYDSGEVSLTSIRRTGTSFDVAARDMVRRLRADGWRVDCIPLGGSSCSLTGTAQDPPYLTARKGSVELFLSFERGQFARPDPSFSNQSPIWTPSASSLRGPWLGVNVTVGRAITPPLVPIGQLAAGLLAAALAWLAFGWISRRTEQRRGALVAYGFLVVALLPPAISEAHTVWSATIGRGWDTAAPIRAVLEFGLLLDLVALPALLALMAMALRPRRVPPTEDPAVSG